MKRTIFMLIFLLISATYAKLNPLDQNIFFNDSNLSKKQISEINGELISCIKLTKKISLNDKNKNLPILLIEFSDKLSDNSIQLLFPKDGISKIIFSTSFNSNLKVELLKMLILHNNYQTIDKTNNKILHWIAVANFYMETHNIENQSFLLSYKYLKYMQNQFIENIIEYPSIPSDGQAFDLYEELSYLSFLPFYKNDNIKKVISSFVKQIDSDSEDKVFKSVFGKQIELEMADYKYLSELDKRKEFFYQNIVPTVLKKQKYCHSSYIDNILNRLFDKQYNSTSLMSLFKNSKHIKMISKNLKKEILQIKPFAPYLYKQNIEELLKLIEKLSILEQPKVNSEMTKIRNNFVELSKIYQVIEKKLEAADKIGNRAYQNLELLKMQPKSENFEEKWKELNDRLKEVENQYLEAFELNMREKKNRKNRRK